jgi:hypothetical protein
LSSSKKQQKRVAIGEGRHRIELLTGKLQTLATRHHQTRVLHRCERRQLGCGLRQQMLQVVEEEERPTLREGFGKCLGERSPGLFPQLEHLCDDREHEIRVAERSERDPEHPVGKPLRDLGDGLQGQACLARSARPDQRE